MSQTLVKKRTVFGGKHEATRGTKETLSGTECAYNVYDLEIDPVIDMDTRQAQGQFGTQKSVPGGSKGKATFKIDLAYDAINIPTWADLLFPACGLVKTSRVFNPKTQSVDASGSALKTVTLGKYTDGKLTLLYGAMGTFKWSFPTSKIATFEFEFDGVYDGESDVAVPAPTYPAATEIKLKCAGGPATFDAVAMCATLGTFDLGNTIYVKECSGQVKGFEYAVITNRAPKFTINPESQLVAVQPRASLFEAGTEKVLRYVVPAAGYNSGTGAKSVEFLANQAQVMSMKEAEREGIAVDDIGFQLNNLNATADSDFSITFNA
jgi:hypothetical protein